MARFLRCWLLALGLLGGLTAEAASPVWVLRGENNTVYLAGSIHLLRPDDAQLPEAFERAYADAEAVVMEIDLDDLDEAQIQRWMIERGTFPEGQTLRQVLGEARHRDLAAALAPLGLPVEAMQQLEPWTIALTLTQLQLIRLGFDPESGVENQLERRARGDRKEILGLETLEEQLGLLDELSYEEQVRFLELTVAELRDIGEQVDELLAAWRSGDIERLSSLLGEEYRKFPRLYEALVSARNARWMPRVEGLLRENRDYLVVVGALHLVGRDGLLELARRRGLDPQPLH